MIEDEVTKETANKNDITTENTPKNNKILKKIKIPLILLNLALLLVLLSQITGISIGVTFTSSMKPNVFGFFLITNDVSEINRGDVVLFTRDGVDYVKRVIGVPGDNILIDKDEIFLNGEILDEPYLDKDYIISNGASPYSDIIQCFELTDEYLCFGDNRNVSVDCREWLESIPKDQIYAKKLFQN